MFGRTEEQKLKAEVSYQPRSGCSASSEWSDPMVDASSCKHCEK